MPCFNCTSRALRIFLHDSLIPSLRPLQQRQPLQLPPRRPVPLLSTYPRLLSHFSTVRRQNQSRFVSADALTDDDYVPFVFPSTSTQLKPGTTAGEALHRASEDKLLLRNHTGWPPPAPKAATGEWVDDWDGEPHIKHTWQLDAGEWSTELEVLEEEGGELSATGVSESESESGDTTGQTPNNPPPLERAGGKIRDGGKRPTIAARKEKMRCDNLSKPVLSNAAKWALAEEERAAQSEQQRLETVSKMAEARGARKGKQRLKRLAAEELRASKEKNKRLAKRAKWAAVEAKQVEVPEGLEVTGEGERGQVQEGQGEEKTKQAENMKVTRGEQGQVEIGQAETKVEVAEVGVAARSHETKKYRKQDGKRAMWWSEVKAYKANNYKTPFRGPRSPAFQEAHPLASQSPDISAASLEASVDLSPRYKRTHRGRRALLATRRSGYFPPATSAASPEASAANSDLAPPYKRTHRGRRALPTTRRSGYFPPATSAASPEASAANSDLAPPYKRTHRGRRALPTTRRSGHFPSYQNDYRGPRTLAREHKPHDPSLKPSHWDLPMPTFTTEPTRLQKYIASQPRKTVESWMVRKAILQEKFHNAPWLSQKRLSPAALEGIRTLHRKHPEYTTEKLSDLFSISPEAVRRIVRSNWIPDAVTQEARMERWARRGSRVFQRWEKLGVVQTKKAKKQVRNWRKGRKWGKQEDGGRREMDNVVNMEEIAGRIV